MALIEWLMINTKYSRFFKAETQPSMEKMKKTMEESFIFNFEFWAGVVLVPLECLEKTENQQRKTS